MTKRLTEGQKRARTVIREATRKMIAELDEWRRNEAYIDFTADFHLACIRYDSSTWMGRPIGCSWPIYVHEKSPPRTQSFSGG